jgi:hypothetical protein
MKTRGVCNAVLVIALFAAGCRGPTQEERDNRRLLDAILTAITLKNARLLEENAARIKLRHDAGQLTDEEYEGMEAFIQKARDGDWSRAEDDGYEFRKRHAFVADGH